MTTAEREKLAARLYKDAAIAAQDERFADEADMLQAAALLLTDAGVHASDCAIHNAPALPVGPCDCGAAASPASVTDEQIAHVIMVEEGCGCTVKGEHVLCIHDDAWDSVGRKPTECACLNVARAVHALIRGER